jgi:hypothetical protein
MRQFTFESFAYFRLRRKETKYISVNSQIGFTSAKSWKPIVEWTIFGRFHGSVIEFLHHPALLLPDANLGTL